MNRDYIILMAEKSGFQRHEIHSKAEEFEYFAHLVATAEREANKDRIETLYQMYKMASQQRDELMRQQTAAIRERGAP